MSTAATTSSSRSSTRPAIIAILAISAAATLFLFWLIYEHPAADTTRTQLAFLPALNALLNGLSATALLIGFTFIRARRIAAHRASMITAFAFSTLFLGSYILHHYLHGDVKYPVHALPHTLSLTARQPHHSGHACTAFDPGYVFLFAFGQVPSAPQSGPMDVSHVAVRLRYRRHHLRDVAPGARTMTPMPAAQRTPDTARRPPHRQRRHAPVAAMGIVDRRYRSSRSRVARGISRRLLTHRRQHQRRMVCPDRRAHVPSLRRPPADPRRSKVAA